MRYASSFYCLLLVVFFIAPVSTAQVSEWKSLDEYIERVTLGDPVARARYTAPLQSFEPVLKAGSIFFVDIKGVERLSGAYTADDKGRVDFPMIGPLAVAGLKPKDLAFSLQTIYERDLLRNPTITVTLPEKKTDDILIVTGEGQKINLNLKRPEPVMDILKREGLLKTSANVFPIYVFQDDLGGTRMKIIKQEDAANPRYKGPLAFPNDRIILWDWRTLFTTHPSLKTTPDLNALMQVKITTLPER